MLISRVPFPPFVVEHDIVRDRFGGHVCEVDPHGIVYTDEIRAHLTQLVCNALNRDAEDARRERAVVAAEGAFVPPVHPADYGHEVWSAALVSAVQDERAAVVAWLRGQSQLTLYDDKPDDIADRIERGEHRREEEK